jgi:hypothetical protein
MEVIIIHYTPWHYMKMNIQIPAPAPLSRGKELRGTHWIGGLVDLTAGLDLMAKRISLPQLGINLWSFS